jgi:adapter protein MecA 1/2
MRIEKISDTQLKIILTRDDFKERDIKLSELTYNSEKAQALFRDIMERAASETGFDLDNSPLIIEAMPISTDSIMVMVSKAQGNNADFISPFANFFNKFTGPDEGDCMCPASGSSFSHNNYNSHNSQNFYTQPNRRYKVSKNISIYSFDSIDDASSASERLYGDFNGASSLHKYNGKYFICLQLPYKTAAVQNMGSFETILGEYGQKHISNTVSRGFLLEHGELLINSNAVNKLAQI